MGIYPRAAISKDPTMIHVAITRRVRPGKEAQFETALYRFFRDALDASTSAALIRPGPDSEANEYGILRTFPDERAKASFYASAVYQRWLDEVTPLVEGEVDKRELHGLEAFVRGKDSHGPPAWRMALVTWLGVNPAVWLFAQGVPRVIPGCRPWSSSWSSTPSSWPR